MKKAKLVIQFSRCRSRVSSIKSRQLGWWPYFAVIGPILLYFFPLLVLSQAPTDFGDDTAFYFYPLTATGMAEWRAGRAPLWTSNIQTGFPLLADGQGALLYPPNLLFYWFLPGPLANNLVIALQTILSAVAMYLLARSLRLPTMSAVLSSWIWVAAAVFGSQSSPQLNVVAWWPLLVRLALGLVASRRRWHYVALASSVTGLMWLGGFPQMAIYGVILASAFLLYALYAVFASPPMAGTYAGFTVEDAEMKRTDSVPLALFTAKSGLVVCFQSIILWTLGLGLGVGMAAIQLLPTLEMSAFSVRAGGVEYGLAEHGSLFPTGLLGYINPGWAVGGFLSAPVYIGILALALALSRFRGEITSLERFLWVIAGVALLLAFGRYTPLYYVVSKLPGLSFLRLPYRFTLLATFALSLLAAQGFSRLSDTLPLTHTLRPLEKRLGLVVGVAVAISLLGGLAARWGRDLILEMAGQFVQRTLLGGRYRLQAWDYYEAKISAIYTQIVGALSPTSPRTLQPIVIAALVLLALRYWRTSTAGRGQTIPLFWLPAMLLLLVGIDLILLVGNPLSRLSPPDRLSPPAIASQIVATFDSPSATADRLYENVTQTDITGGSDSFSSLRPNYSLLFGIPHTGVYSALGSVRYFELLGPLGGVNLTYGLPQTSPEALRQNLHVLALIGARYVLANQPLDDARLTPLNSSQPYLYLNPAALPRAFFVPRAVFASPAEALRLVRSPDFSPLEVVVLETKVDITFPADGRRPSAVIQRDEGGLLEVRTSGAGWLVLVDLHYPGWRARVDGMETPIYRANAVFRAIAIAEPEDHLVTFSYEPDSFKYGLWLSAISLALILALVAIVVQRR